MSRHSSKIRVLCFLALVASGCGDQYTSSSGPAPKPDIVPQKPDALACYDLRGTRDSKPLTSFINDAPPAEIKIMAYNVENFFDAEYVPKTNISDFQYLPKNHPVYDNCENPEMVIEQNKAECIKYRDAKRKADWVDNFNSPDWTPEKVETKLNQVKKMVDSQGNLPDMMALEEVENGVIVEALRKKLGFEQMRVSTGSDRRGINVGLLFNTEKVTFIESKEHVFTYAAPLQSELPSNMKESTDSNAYEAFKKEYERPSRNTLAVFFSLKAGDAADVLGVYVNHWPSQGNPAPKRVSTAKQLMKYVKDDTAAFEAQGKNLHVVMLGDFNTTATDSPHPFLNVLFEDERKFVDVGAYFRKANNLPKADEDAKKKMPLGTSFFEGSMTWDSLDVIFGSSSLFDKKGLEMKYSSYRIVAPEFAMKNFRYDNPNNKNPHHYGSVIWGVPMRYDHGKPADSKTTGFADHLPITVNLTINP